MRIFIIILLCVVAAAVGGALGAYWGIGAPLWRLTSQDGTPLGFVRADTAADAMMEHANKGC